LGIESPHPEYAANLGRWQRCRDAYEGEDAVKAKGEYYLPKVDPTQEKTGYSAYLARAPYYEAVSRTVDGFVGAISRKEDSIELPGRLAVMISDATTDGTGLAEFKKLLSGEALLMGRGGVLVEWDTALARPYLAFYAAENILNWWDGGVVLSETVYASDASDPFKQVAVQQLRLARLEDGIYRVTLWRRQTGSSGNEWQIYEEIVPDRRAVPLQQLPWFWVSPVGRTAKIAKPPLLGLVNVSFHHYCEAADLAHGRHFTALPTLYVTGVTDESPIVVGAGAVIKLPDAQCKAGYAEFTGAGLGSLEKGLEQKEQQMAVLGAAVFAGGKKGVEAAETARIRTSAENSLLMGVVSSVEETLMAALTFARDWLGEAGEILLHLNRDFIDTKLDPQTLQGMVAAYQAGAMSLDAFLFCLDQADMLPPGTDLDGEAKKLAAAKAAAAALAVVA